MGESVFFMGVALADPSSSRGWPHTQYMGSTNWTRWVFKGGGVCKARRRSGDEYDQNPLEDILKKITF